MRNKFFNGLLVSISFAAILIAQVPRDPFPVKRAESAETWRRDGWNFINHSKALIERKNKAKNVILFIGDGMGVSTLTAARIFEGQKRGESGEENRLSFEDFPYSALSKTYSANQQTSDSAPTMSAIISGVKTDEGILSVNQNVVHDDYKTVAGNETKTLLEYAEESGRSTGVVTTVRVTHATPGACYAHTADRNWESDADIFNWRKDAYEAKFPDIARQLLEFKYGDGLDVVFGGGRNKFLPRETADPEYPTRRGERLDGRDLTKEWTTKYQNSAYVWNAQQFAAIDPKRTRHLLALFEPSYMAFDYDRPKDAAGEPSLSEMTSKAIDMLSQNQKGYFLMVEGGKIDIAHHSGNAFRALSDTVALSDAVRTALSKVNLDDTLIVVTADHSHTLFIQGYPIRGNNILGLIREVGDDGNAEPKYKVDRLGMPMTTLGYANGRGYQGESNNQPAGPKMCCTAPSKFSALARPRFDLSLFDTTAPDYLQEAGIPLSDETHGGEDVAIYAAGVNAHLIHGSMEQNWIFYVMADALKVAQGPSSSLASGGCLAYEPSQVQISGTITRQTFPGRPNYESIAKGDERETYWIVHPSKPICVNASADFQPERNVSALQLVFSASGDEYTRYKNLLGKKVVVSGSLFAANTGHHHTKVLISVSGIARNEK